MIIFRKMVYSICLIFVLTWGMLYSIFNTMIRTRDGVFHTYDVFCGAMYNYSTFIQWYLRYKRWCILYYMSSCVRKMVYSTQLIQFSVQDMLYLLYHMLFLHKSWGSVVEKRQFCSNQAVINSPIFMENRLPFCLDSNFYWNK